MQTLQSQQFSDYQTTDEKHLLVWKEYNYVIKVIYSCENKNQFECCLQMIKNFKEKILFYYSLHKLDERNSALSKKLTNIKNDILSHRSSGNINKVNFNLIDCYNNKHLLKDIINNFNNYIMNIISTLLPIYIK